MQRMLHHTELIMFLILCSKVDDLPSSEFQRNELFQRLLKQPFLVKPQIYLIAFMPTIVEKKLLA